MFKPILVLACWSVLLIAESSCQHIIYPTYRPPPRKVIIRTARETGEPLWLYKGDDVPRAPATGDHPFLPSYIDDIKLDPNRRTVRILSTPRASRGGGTRQSSSRVTGPTHPGYNRRNARDIRIPDFFEPRPRPYSPWNPTSDRKPIPIYARSRRDLGQEEFFLASQEQTQIEGLASQEQLRTKRGVEPLASQEQTQFEGLASQEQLRSKRSVETLASQEQSQIEGLASQEQLRTKRGVEPLASQEHIHIELASQEQLRTKRSVESFASQEQTKVEVLDG